MKSIPEDSVRYHQNRWEKKLSHQMGFDDAFYGHGKRLQDVTGERISDYLAGYDRGLKIKDILSSKDKFTEVEHG